MTRRGQVDQTRAGFQQRDDSVGSTMTPWLVPNWVSKPSEVWPFGQAMTPALAITRSNGSPVEIRASAQPRTLASDADRVPPTQARHRSPPVREPARSRPSPYSDPARHQRPGRRARPGYRQSPHPDPADTPVTSMRLPLRSTPSSTSSVVDVAPNCRFMVFSAIGVCFRQIGSAFVRPERAMITAESRQETYRWMLSLAYLLRLLHLASAVVNSVVDDAKIGIRFDPSPEE